MTRHRAGGQGERRSLLRSMVVTFALAAPVAMACASRYGEEPAGSDVDAAAIPAEADAPLADAYVPAPSADASADGPRPCDGGSGPTRACGDRYIFATRATLRGDFGVTSASASALELADQFCSAQAQRYGVADLVGRTWRAWMCTSKESAVGRVAPEEARWIRPDGREVFKERKELEESRLSNALVTPTEATVSVWTGCNANGLAVASVGTCGDWRSGMGTGGAGQPQALDGTFSYAGEVGCDGELGLVCVEVGQ